MERFLNACPRALLAFVLVHVAAPYAAAQAVKVGSAEYQQRLFEYRRMIQGLDAPNKSAPAAKTADGKEAQIQAEKERTQEADRLRVLAEAEKIEARKEQERVENEKEKRVALMQAEINKLRSEMEKKGGTSDKKAKKATEKPPPSTTAKDDWSAETITWLLGGAAILVMIVGIVGTVTVFAMRRKGNRRSHLI
jgi:Skp family chaperone for outer membrane proteins